ncbi:M64 family metallopeptidase [Streptomyces sp. NPDC002851]
MEDEIVQLLKPGALAATGLALAALLAATADGAVADPAPSTDGPTVEAEYFPHPEGTGRTTRVPVNSPPQLVSSRDDLSAREAAGDGDVTPIAETGPSADRLDVTIIGDGYTAAEERDFLADAKAKWADVTGIEPYRSYTGLFNVWAVSAASAESGVSGDPDSSVVRNTALGSYFWCDDIERLLCADLDKVKSYADKAPETDLVVVVANSTKYGGAGYSGLDGDYGFAGVSTLSSDNDRSSLIAAHEIGHSIGLLADEYTYDDYGTYDGPERPAPNVSIHDAEQLAARKTKWYRWLGENDPSGGTVGAYEGGDYYPRGIRRPTESSLMRTLAATEFNLPGREALIEGFYRYAKPLTAETDTGEPVERDTKLAVRLAELPPGLSRLHLRWYVDGREARQVRGDTRVVPRDLGVPADGRSHTVTARTVDSTGSLRAPEARAAAVSAVTWTVRVQGLSGSSFPSPAPSRNWGRSPQPPTTGASPQTPFAGFAR